MIEKWINPVDGVITSEFGERVNPILNKDESHDGVDIAVAEGTNVLSVRDGRVTEVGISPTYGNFIKYKTADNYEIMYAHLSEVLRNTDDEIKQGEVIAKSGNTGLSTGPHLHYSVYKDGELSNPIQFMK